MVATKSYNGDISRLTAIQDEHSKRITKLEDCYRDDHDKITAIDARLSSMEEMLERHLKWHEEISKQMFTIKQGVVLILVNAVMQMIAIYIISTMS